MSEIEQNVAPGSTKKWYVLRAAGGKEKKAMEYLQKEIERYKLTDFVGQILVPVEKKYKVRDGKRVVTESILFPSYVLIEAELTGELEYLIRNEVPHISGFLTERKGSSRPVPLREDEVDRILGKKEEKVETVFEFHVGDPVRITDGPFNGFDGTVEEIIEERSKIKIAVVVFERKTILELNFTQVAKE